MVPSRTSYISSSRTWMCSGGQALVRRDDVLQGGERAVRRLGASEDPRRTADGPTEHLAVARKHDEGFGAAGHGAHGIGEHTYDRPGGGRMSEPVFFISHFAIKEGA